MKRIQIIIICCFLIIAANAQTNNQPKQASDRLSAFHENTRKMPGIRNYDLQQDSYLFQRNTQKSTRILKQKMDSLIAIASFDGQTENLGKYEITYNYLGYITSYFEYEWDGNENKWMKIWKSEITYDAGWNIIQEIFFDWDMDVNQWITSSKDNYSYDEANRLVLTMGYSWELITNSWLLNFKDEDSYTANSKTTIRYSWDEQSGTWIIGFKDELLYDSEGKLLLENSYHWEPIDGFWENLHKIEYAYNASGKLETQIVSSWLSDSESWELFENEQFSYNQEGDLTVHTIFEWDDIDSQWIPYSKEENEYNDQFDFNEILVPEIFIHNELYFNHMLTKMSLYGSDFSSGAYLGNYMFYYSEIDVTDIQNNQPAQTCIYPNPATDFITIETSTITGQKVFITITDLSGRIVLTETIPAGLNKFQIPVSQLASGCYIVKLVDENQHKSAVLIR